MRRLLEELSRYDTPTVANAAALLQRRDPSLGFAGPDVRALTPEFGIRVGVAVTARLDTTSAGMDEPPDLFPEWLRLIAKAGAQGTIPVIGVIEAVGPRPRHTVTIGDCMGTLMRLAGAVGMVTNGCIRDIAGVRKVPMACWGCGFTPMHAALRWSGLNETVYIDGMPVKPGDIIHADENGVIVLPPEDLADICAKVPEVVNKERQLFEAVKKGGMTIEDYLRSIGLAGQ
ncbi:MAG TPA: RraA family protein [Firmicutes bacterium]|nr:RraA family protein [Bacillota bacterium]